MGHPAEHYVKYILATKWGTSGQEEFSDQNEVNQSLKVLGIPGLLEKHFNDIWSHFDPPADFCLLDPNHGPTAQFMEEQKLTAMWMGEPAVKRAVEEIIVQRPQLQFRVNVLLLGRLPTKVIAERLSGKFHMFPPMTERMIDLYRHYFWKVDYAGYDEWDEILAGSAYHDHYMASLYNGESQALWRAGFSPKVDVKKSLKEAQKHIYFRLKALEALPSDKFVLDQTIKLARELRYLYATLYAEGEGLPERLRELRVFLMKHDIPDVKELEQLVDRKQGGGFSGDGASEEGVIQ
jgi:hypothetical protein